MRREATTRRGGDAARARGPDAHPHARAKTSAKTVLGAVLAAALLGAAGPSALASTEGQLRLAGGTTANEGRVEIYHDGEWGAVCDDEFSDRGNQAANVACTQMGYTSGVVKWGWNPKPDGMTYWLDNVNCDGTETELSACTHAGWGVHNCDRTETAQITCSGTPDEETASNVPGEVERPTMTPASTTSIDIAWSAPDSDADITSYEVRHRWLDKGSDDDPEGPWVSTTVTGTSSTATGLTQGTDYEAQVRATSANGTGAWSMRNEARTHDVPYRAYGVRASAHGTDAISVRWTAVDSDPATNDYDLRYRKNVSPKPDWTVADETELTGTSTRIEGLDANTHYEVQVRAGNRVGEGPWSRTARAQTEDDSPAITGFVLVDPANDNDIGTLAGGASIESAKYGIRAEVGADAGVASVKLVLARPSTGSRYGRTENVAPYSLYGDAQGAEHGRIFAAGSYTLSATAYAGTRGSGGVLGTHEVSFTVTEAPAADPITGFTLLDSTDQSTIASLGTDTTVDIGAGGGATYAVRAEVADGADIGSVVLALTGAKSVSRTESVAPYSLYGDGGANALDGGTLPAGSYTLTATAHAERGGAGDVLGTHTATFEVLAAPALGVGDASVAEAADATLAFEVTLSRAAAEQVQVDYATSDGTATAGSDYTATSGTLTFAVGETTKTVSVTVASDSHDEGAETMTLTLTNARGAIIDDAEGTGTITNDGAIPAAWLARFGRTVTGQVLDAVEDRIAAPRTAGAEGRIAGRGLDGATRAGEPAGRGMGAEPTTLSASDALLGSAFALTGEGGRSGSAAVWARGAETRFEASENGLELDGTVTSGFVGADWARDGWIAGAALGHSRASGGYAEGACAGANGCAGDVEAALTGVYPYAGADIGEDTTAWASAGYGTGTVTVAPKGANAMKADLSLTMGAMGVRSALIAPQHEGGTEIATVASVEMTRTASDASESAAGRLAASESDVWQLRAGVEGTRTFAMQGAAVTPKLALAVRQDGGDAEEGTGAEIGAGVAVEALGGALTLALDAHGLVAHEASGAEEMGLSGSARFDARPGSERGLSASVRQRWGEAGPEGAGLLARGLPAAFTSGEGAGTPERASVLDAEIGYGLAMGARTATPHFGTTLGEGVHSLRAGWRISGGDTLSVGLEGARTERAGEGAEHAVMVRAGLRW